MKTQGPPVAGETWGAEVIKLRGGDGLIHNNTIDAGFIYSVVLCRDWYLHGDEQCNPLDDDVTDDTVTGITGHWPPNWLGQTRRRWVCANAWGAAPQKITFDHGEYYFHDDWVFFQCAPTSARLGYNYQPFAYPHPVQGSESIFQRGFE